SLSRTGRVRPTRGQAGPKMPASAAPPRPGSQFPLLLLAVLSGPVCGLVSRWVPRTSLPVSEADTYVTRFSIPQTYNYSVFLVDPASHTLYVGARDTIFALSLPFSEGRPRRIDWMVPEGEKQNCMAKGKEEDECHNFVQILAIVNDSHLLTCGTFAFDPKFGVIAVSSFQQVERIESGRGKCPFGPAQRSASVIAGGALYAATVRNFLGTEPIISRAVRRAEGQAEDWIRTEAYWLDASAFVAAMALRPAEWGDEDGDKEIYFFFTETSQAFDSKERLKVPRVARVCAGDLGGLRSLQKRWTTFLKADLRCPGPEGGRTSSVLQDMAILRPETGVGAPIFYGIFFSQWEGAAISAVCAFRPQDIRTVLNGPFRELKDVCNRGQPVTDSEVPQPRPGECIANNPKFQQFNSSLSLPDRVLSFIRDHPLMYRPVLPADGHSLLVTTDTVYLRVVAHRVASLSGKEYDVLYLGTEDGHLHRAVRIGAKLSVLEDLALFPEPQPVENMKLYQSWLLVGSHTEVTQVNTTNCGRLQSCSECILAQDPVCAWSFRLYACVAHAGEHGGLASDEEVADCYRLGKTGPGENIDHEVPMAIATPMAFPCSPLSEWSDCFYPRRDGEVVVTPGAMGAYCECQEGGAARVVAAYSLVWGSHQVPPQLAHTVGAGLAGFFLGVLAASLTLNLIGRHQQRQQEREPLARNEVGSDLGAPPSGTTSSSQDPPSSPEDEWLPLDLDKRGSGFGGFPPTFLLESCPSPAHIRLTGAPLTTCDETPI
uniref:Semaphorin-4F n=1 Tax=Myotis lucifugus TaxID=59463 RepID=G1QE64_MYOLU